MKDPQGVALDHQGVGQVLFPQGGGGELGIAPGDFNAEEIDLRPGRRGIAQEKPLARADLDLQRPLAAEQRRGPPGLRQLLDRLQVAREVESGVDFSQSRVGPWEERDLGIRDWGERRKAGG